MLLAGSATALAACATIRQIQALRHVQFDIDRVADVRLGGVRLDHVRSYSDLSVLDAGRLAAAVARDDLPLVLNVMVRGENPPENRVTARLVRMTWTLALNGRETVSGTIDTSYTFPPGAPTVFAVPISLDVLDFFRTSGRDAFNLAAGLVGAPGAPATQVSLLAVPVIDTPLGAITYPERIQIVRRTVGGP